MRKILFAVCWYAVFDLIFIINNHFEYFNKNKPNYFFAWLPFIKDGVMTTYYGNDYTVLVFIPLLLLILLLSFLITKTFI